MDVLNFIRKTFPKFVTQITIKNDIYYITVTHKDFVSIILNILKFNMLIQAKQLLDVWVVDLKQSPERFQVNYLLLSLKLQRRIIVRTAINDLQYINSVVDTYPSANWLERESYDMFGVLFSNHPDLRRILTDYGFEGYPLRKDFPLTGFTEVRYDDEINRIVFEPVDITQEFRYFDFISPWEQHN